MGSFWDEVKVGKENEESGFINLLLKWVFDYKIKLCKCEEIDFFNKNLDELKVGKESVENWFLTLPKPVFSHT